MQKDYLWGIIIALSSLLILAFVGILLAGCLRCCRLWKGNRDDPREASRVHSTEESAEHILPCEEYI